MAQRYGGEIYGKSAMQANMKGNTTSSPRPGSLITCSVGKWMLIPGGGFKESTGGFRESTLVQEGSERFKKAYQALCDWLSSKKSDEEWYDDHESGCEDLWEFKKDFDYGDSAKSKTNDKVYVKVTNILWKSKPWKDDYKNDSEFKKLCTDLGEGWEEWSKGGGGDDGPSDAIDQAKGEDGWNPNMTFRIDIHTSFDEDWFKRKFKSGFLNKAIMAIKTDAASKMTDAATGDGMEKGHKYTQDEMLPGDRRKLDKIQWKMTTKVAKDYITYLLGWSRAKKRTPDGQPIEALKADKGFGQTMADRATSNRGILGRLAAKIFAGGQANNAISVVFQLADPDDGWTVQEDKKAAEKAPPPGADDAANESSAPFADPFSESTFADCLDGLSLAVEDSGQRFDSPRRELAEAVLEGREPVSELVDRCLLGGVWG